MSNNGIPESASDILNEINKFLEPTEDELLQMPIEDVRKDLVCAGIDVDKDVKKIKCEITSIVAKEKLNQAKEDRIHLIENLKEFASSVKDFNKVDLVSRIKEKLGFNDKQAMVYYRKFEECREEDLKTLLDDFELLGRINKKL